MRNSTRSHQLYQLCSVHQLLHLLLNSPSKTHKVFAGCLWFAVFHQCAQMVLYQALSWTNPRTNLKFLPRDDVDHSTKRLQLAGKPTFFLSTRHPPTSDAIITWLVSSVQRLESRSSTDLAKQLTADLVTPSPNRSYNFYNLLVTNSSAAVTPLSCCSDTTFHMFSLHSICIAHFLNLDLDRWLYWLLIYTTWPKIYGQANSKSSLDKRGWSAKGVSIYFWL